MDSQSCPIAHVFRSFLLVAMLFLAGACASGEAQCPEGSRCPEPGTPGQTDGVRPPAPVPPASESSDTRPVSGSPSGTQSTRDTEQESFVDGVGERIRGEADSWDPEGFLGTDYDPEAGGVVVTGAGRVSDIFWIPNTGDSTVSRWNAATAAEEARYYTGYPNGASEACLNTCCWTNQCNMPSRVVVDDAGNAYVANRGFEMQASVTKIAGDVSRCIDREATGSIDTSTGPTPVPWAPGSDLTSYIPSDDCVLWTVPIPPGEHNGTPRAIAIDLGDKNSLEGYVWVSAEAQRRFYRLDPVDGTIVDVVENLPLAPYGAIVMPDGRLWYHSLGLGPPLEQQGIGWIDTETLDVSPVIPPPRDLRTCNEDQRGQLYGVTGDSSGRLWFTGVDCADVVGYDTTTGEWSVVPARYTDAQGEVVQPFHGRTVGRGITVDVRGRIWVALAEGATMGGQSSIAVFDGDRFNPGGEIRDGIQVIDVPLPTNSPSGIALDSEGRVWLGHFEGNSEMVRYDPERPVEEAFASYTGFNRIYTYSDFTGAVRRTTIGRGVYRDRIDLRCDAPEEVELAVDISLPPGARVEISAETAATREGLESGVTVDLARLPPPPGLLSLSEIFDSVGEPLERWVRIDYTLLLGDAVASPILSGSELRWRCPEADAPTE